MVTSRTAIRDTRTFDGSEASRSISSLDHENLLRSTSCCSGVSWFLTASALFRSPCSCCRRLLISNCKVCARLLATVVSRTTTTSPISETNRMIAVTAHGSRRLLNGLDARLRSLFTAKKDTRLVEVIANELIGTVTRRWPAFVAKVGRGLSHGVPAAGLRSVTTSGDRHRSRCARYV